MSEPGTGIMDIPPTDEADSSRDPLGVIDTRLKKYMDQRPLPPDWGEFFAARGSLRAFDGRVKKGIEAERDAPLEGYGGPWMLVNGVRRSTRGTETAILTALNVEIPNSNQNELGMGHSVDHLLTEDADLKDLGLSREEVKGKAASFPIPDISGVQAWVFKADGPIDSSYTVGLRINQEGVNQIKNSAPLPHQATQAPSAAS